MEDDITFGVTWNGAYTHFHLNPMLNKPQRLISQYRLYYFEYGPNWSNIIILTCSRDLQRIHLIILIITLTSKHDYACSKCTSFCWIGYLEMPSLTSHSRVSLRQVIMQQKVDRFCETGCFILFFILYFKRTKSNCALQFEALKTDRWSQDSSTLLWPYFLIWFCLHYLEHCKQRLEWPCSHSVMRRPLHT